MTPIIDQRSSSFKEPDEGPLTASISLIMEKKLQKAFQPTVLKIMNESHQHHGHLESPRTGASHFKIFIASPAFQKLSKVQAHQVIYKVLASELAGPVHALSITFCEVPRSF